MRRTVGGTALVATAALLLTGCGSDGGDGDGGDKGGGDKAESSQSEPAGNGSDSDDAGEADTDSDDAEGSDAEGSDADADGGGQTREVTFEVTGDGEPQGEVMYGAGDMNSEALDKLPWKKTTKVTLQGAQAKVGVLVNVVPPSVTGANGMPVNAGCVISVDGKKVADNKGGEDTTPCEYTMK